MRARVTRAYERPYVNPISVTKGEAVQPDFTRYTDIDGWVWCTAGDGRSGWTPKGWLQETSGVWRIDRAFNAIELTVQAGEELRVHGVESGFYWAEKADGTLGWVPCENIAMDSRD